MNFSCLSFLAWAAQLTTDILSPEYSVNVTEPGALMPGE